MAVADRLDRRFGDMVGGPEIGLADAEADDVTTLRRQRIGAPARRRRFPRPGDQRRGRFSAWHFPRVERPPVGNSADGCQTPRAAKRHLIMLSYQALAATRRHGRHGPPTSFLGRNDCIAAPLPAMQIGRACVPSRSSVSNASIERRAEFRRRNPQLGFCVLQCRGWRGADTGGDRRHRPVPARADLYRRRLWRGPCSHYALWEDCIRNGKP